jgi:adenosylmethionine-8-amino-7-oxononanoate aminotransferase
MMSNLSISQATRGPCWIARRLYVGSGRQALFGWIVGRDGLQYRPFQPTGFSGDAAPNGKIHVWLWTAFETEASEALAKKLAGLMPDGLNKVFFVSGGSEAVESAMKLARQNAIATDNATRWKVFRAARYHGCTLGALAVTGYATLTNPFAPMMQEMPKFRHLVRIWTGLIRTTRQLAHYADMLKHRPCMKARKPCWHFLSNQLGASTGAGAASGLLERIREICDHYGVS